ncbi:MAG: hypothetical protein FWE22_06060 [Firmicutes bacterium]|nr:hypothetical protein [Bacillota bacterium]
MKSKKCINCANYIAYYKQLSNRYVKLNNGFCTKQKTPKTQHETCKEFQFNECKERTKEERLLYSLEQSLQSINDIAQILADKIQ